jgi:hypothetical protein
MKRCKTHVVRVCLFLLATVPAYCQRGTLGIDVGQTSDKFGALPSVNGLEFDVDGQITVIKGKQKNGSPSIVAGGEVRLPTDTGNHAKEYAVFGGPMFQYHKLTFGVEAQVHKIILPTQSFDNQFFVRDTMELLELPVVLRYTFGTPGAARHAFIQATGAPEFTPRWHMGTGSLVSLPNPTLDHGYFIRGSAGYTFGKWYAKATYETRYFKFSPTTGNPNGLYNWRSNLITGGVGFVF